MLRTLWSLSLAALSVMLTAALAHADTLTFTLSKPTQTATAGSTVNFTATVSTPGTNTGSYLLSDNYNFNRSSAVLTLDDTGFVNNFFGSFDPNTSVTALLFSVALPSNIASGAYTGFFELFDGSDYLTSNVNATATFEIDVPAAASPVPEPGSWLLLATGVTCTAAFALRRNGLSFLNVR